MKVKVKLLLLLVLVGKVVLMQLSMKVMLLLVLGREVVLLPKRLLWSGWMILKEFYISSEWVPNGF